MADERKFIAENVRRLLLKDYLKSRVSRAGFGGLDIQRTPLGTRVRLIIERPGLVIGKKGGAIRDLTTAVEKEFSFDHPQIEVEEVKKPGLNAQIMAYKLAESLERGWHFRRAGHSTVRRIMESGAVGCQVVISGKLTGQRHRVEKFKDGHIKFCGEPRLRWVEEGFATATVKLGVIGVKVQITHPDTKLPDEISIVDSLPEEGDEASEVEKVETEEKPEKKKKSGKSKKKADPGKAKEKDTVKEANEEAKAESDTGEQETLHKEAPAKKTKKGAKKKKAKDADAEEKPSIPQEKPSEGIDDKGKAESDSSEKNENKASAKESKKGEKKEISSEDSLQNEDEGEVIKEVKSASEGNKDGGDSNVGSEGQ